MGANGGRGAGPCWLPCASGWERSGSEGSLEARPATPVCVPSDGCACRVSPASGPRSGLAWSDSGRSWRHVGRRVTSRRGPSTSSAGRTIPVPARGGPRVPVRGVPSELRPSPRVARLDRRRRGRRPRRAPRQQARSGQPRGAFLLPRGCHMRRDQRGQRGPPGQPLDVSMGGHCRCASCLGSRVTPNRGSNPLSRSSSLSRHTEVVAAELPDGDAGSVRDERRQERESPAHAVAAE